jgi:hypothetical protein
MLLPGKEEHRVGKSGKSSTIVPVDRRRSASKERRKSTERRAKQEPVVVERRQIERRVKVARRRQIDPTTCERDYSPAEVEFMSALDDYKRRSGRMFPTCSEILEVILALGYEKRRTGDGTDAPTTPNTDPSIPADDMDATDEE